MISVIYIHWNCFNLLIQSIESVVKHTTMPFEVVVVDNHSDFCEKTLRESFPQLGSRLIIQINEENSGFSKATNQGVGLAKGDYILWLNCDTYFEEDVIGLTYRESIKWEHKALIGVRHLNQDKTYQASAHEFPKLWKNTWGLFYAQPYAPEKNPSITMDVDWICGSYIFMSRKTWDTIGKVDEQFFTYDEDIDYCFRAKKCDCRVLYSSCSQIVHLGSATGLYIKDKTFLNLRSRYLFFRKYYGTILGFVFYVGVFIKILAGIILHPFQSDLRKRSQRVLQWIRLIF